MTKKILFENFIVAAEERREGENKFMRDGRNFRTIYLSNCELYFKDSQFIKKYFPNFMTLFAS